MALMAEAVCKDDVAAFLCKVDSGIVALFVFGNVILEDSLVFCDSESFHGGMDALEVGGVIADLLVVEQDETDLESSVFDGLLYIACVGGLIKAGRYYLAKGKFLGLFAFACLGRLCGLGGFLCAAGCKRKEHE